MRLTEIWRLTGTDIFLIGIFIFFDLFSTFDYFLKFGYLPFGITDSGMNFLIFGLAVFNKLMRWT